MNQKSVESLQVNDTAYVFGGGGGRRGATGGTEVKVIKVGRTYLYAKSPSSKHGEEIKFDRKTGVEADVDNYKRLLVVDRDAYIANQNSQVAYSKLRQALGHKKPDGVTLADIEAAAKLLGVALEG
jgi:hypothetical protein